MLANLLKGRRAKQHIAGIRSDTGEITSNPAEINNAFRNFYSQLYSSEFDGDESRISTFLNPLSIPSTPPDLVNKLEAPITQAEITQAISLMQSGKTPGPDGFPSEFFKQFSRPLSAQFAAVLLESHQRGSLPPSMKEAVITFIAKKGKDPVDCASYRPISLLNTDAKILAKVLALRLDEALPHIITTDQTGFIKNRHSFFNIRRLLDVIYTLLRTKFQSVLFL